MCMLTEQIVTIYENINVVLVLAIVITFSQLMMFPNMLCLQSLVYVHHVYSKYVFASMHQAHLQHTPLFFF